MVFAVIDRRWLGGRAIRRAGVHRRSCGAFVPGLFCLRRAMSGMPGRSRQGVVRRTPGLVRRWLCVLGRLRRAGDCRLVRDRWRGRMRIGRVRRREGLLGQRTKGRSQQDAKSGGQKFLIHCQSSKSATGACVCTRVRARCMTGANGMARPALVSIKRIDAGEGVEDRPG